MDDAAWSASVHEMHVGLDTTWQGALWPQLRGSAPCAVHTAAHSMARTDRAPQLHEGARGSGFASELLGWRGVHAVNPQSTRCWRRPWLPALMCACLLASLLRCPPPDAMPVQEGLFDWMTDKLGRDQFVIRAGDMSEVYWNDGKRQRCEEVRPKQPTPPASLPAAQFSLCCEPCTG